jgi:hypothetical protein
MRFSRNPNFASLSLTGSCFGSIGRRASRFVFSAGVIIFAVFQAPHNTKLLEFDVTVVAADP